MWHVAYVEANVLNKQMANTIGVNTYIATCVVNVLFDLIRTEFLPGPLGSRTVWISVLRINVSSEAKVRFSLIEVAWST